MVNGNVPFKEKIPSNMNEQSLCHCSTISIQLFQQHTQSIVIEIPLSFAPALYVLQSQIDMSDEDERWGQNWSHFILQDEIVSLEHPNFLGVGIIAEEGSTEILVSQLISKLADHHYCTWNKSTDLLQYTSNGLIQIQKKMTINDHRKERLTKTAQIYITLQLHTISLFLYTINKDLNTKCCSRTGQHCKIHPLWWAFKKKIDPSCPVQLA